VNVISGKTKLMAEIVSQMRAKGYDVHVVTPEENENPWLYPRVYADLVTWEPREWWVGEYDLGVFKLVASHGPFADKVTATEKAIEIRDAGRAARLEQSLLVLDSVTGDAKSPDTNPFNATNMWRESWMSPDIKKSLLNAKIHGFSFWLPWRHSAH
jgi:hypothetical protein